MQTYSFPFFLEKNTVNRKNCYKGKYRTDFDCFFKKILELNKITKFELDNQKIKILIVLLERKFENRRKREQNVKIFFLFFFLKGWFLEHAKT